MGEEDFTDLAGGVVNQHVAGGGVGPPPPGRCVQDQTEQDGNGENAVRRW